MADGLGAVVGTGEILVEQFRERLAQLPRTKKGDQKFEPEELATISDSDCKRFLQARDLKVDEAADMGRCALEWRMRIQPDKLEASDVPIALPQGCWRFAGHARDGRPICLAKAALWIPSAYTLEEYNKYVGYVMENNLARAKHGQETHVVLFDMANFLMMQSNLSMTRALISINQDYYPERLSLCVIFNTTRIFRWFWRLVYPFIDKKTRDKIQLLSPEDNASEMLLEHIDPEMLEMHYGGTRPVEYPIPPMLDSHVSEAGAKDVKLNHSANKSG